MPSCTSWCCPRRPVAQPSVPILSAIRICLKRLRSSKLLCFEMMRQKSIFLKYISVILTITHWSTIHLLYMKTLWNIIKKINQVSLFHILSNQKIVQTNVLNKRNIIKKKQGCIWKGCTESIIILSPTIFLHTSK